MLNWAKKHVRHKSSGKSNDESPDKGRVSLDTKAGPDKAKTPNKRKLSLDKIKFGSLRGKPSPDKGMGDPDNRESVPDTDTDSSDISKSGRERSSTSPDKGRFSPDKGTLSPDNREGSPDKQKRTPVFGRKFDSFRKMALRKLSPDPKQRREEVEVEEEEVEEEVEREVKPHPPAKVFVLPPLHNAPLLSTSPPPQPPLQPPTPPPPRLTPPCTTPPPSTVPYTPSPPSAVPYTPSSPSTATYTTSPSSTVPYTPSSPSKAPYTPSSPSAVPYTTSPPSTATYTPSSPSAVPYTTSPPSTATCTPSSPSTVPYTPPEPSTATYTPSASSTATYTSSAPSTVAQPCEIPPNTTPGAATPSSPTVTPSTVTPTSRFTVSPTAVSSPLRYSTKPPRTIFPIITTIMKPSPIEGKEEKEGRKEEEKMVIEDRKRTTTSQKGDERPNSGDDAHTPPSPPTTDTASTATEKSPLKPQRTNEKTTSNGRLTQTTPTLFIANISGNTAMEMERKPEVKVEDPKVSPQAPVKPQISPEASFKLLEITEKPSDQQEMNEQTSPACLANISKTTETEIEIEVGNNAQDLKVSPEAPLKHLESPEKPRDQIESSPEKASEQDDSDRTSILSIANISTNTEIAIEPKPEDNAQDPKVSPEVLEKPPESPEKPTEQNEVSDQIVDTNFDVKEKSGSDLQQTSEIGLVTLPRPTESPKQSLESLIEPLESPEQSTDPQNKEKTGLEKCENSDNFAALPEQKMDFVEKIGNGVTADNECHSVTDNVNEQITYSDNDNAVLPKQESIGLDLATLSEGGLVCKGSEVEKYEEIVINGGMGRNGEVEMVDKEGRKVEDSATGAQVKVGDGEMEINGGNVRDESQSPEGDKEEIITLETSLKEIEIALKEMEMQEIEIEREKEREKEEEGEKQLIDVNKIEREKEREEKEGDKQLIDVNKLPPTTPAASPS